MNAVKEILIGTRELLAAPESWTKNVFARDASGTKVCTSDLRAVCWCLKGAMSVAATAHGLIDDFTPLTDAEMLLEKLLGDRPVAPWQDEPERTHEEVLALLDRAIETVQ
jgi:hypothetical protein